MGCKLKDLFGFIIHVLLSALYFYSADEIVFPLLLYGKTFTLIIIILITSFSQYTTICFVSFTLFGFQWTFWFCNYLQNRTSLYLEVSLVSFLFKESNWWRWWDSNPWPPACRAGALPTELHPHFKWLVVSPFLFLTHYWIMNDE